MSWLKKKNGLSVNDAELQQILQSEHCDKCPRNCILTAAKCSRGKKQIDIVMNSYTNSKNQKPN